MSGIVGRLRQFDAYSKPLDDFRVKTLSGGTVTLISSVLMVLLFIGELQYYLSKEVVEELFVDTSRGEDRIKINFDLTFPVISCEFLTVDAMDVTGDTQSDVTHDVKKIRLDLSGKPLPVAPLKAEIGTTTVAAVSTTQASTTEPKCGSCYGAETEQRKCCSTCDEVKEAYRRKGWGVIDLAKFEQCKGEPSITRFEETKKEGCQLSGFIQVAKVSGNFHIAPGKSARESHGHVHDLNAIPPDKFNTTHHISHFSFGESFPGKVYPLDNKTFKADQGGLMFQYFMKIVPTTYTFLGQEADVMTHQFSVTKHKKPIGQGSFEGGLPGFFVLYEFSPLVVKLTEKRRSFAQFLTSVCAIVGGVFTVASLLDSILYHSSRAFRKKMELGKAI